MNVIDTVSAVWRMGRAKISSMSVVKNRILLRQSFLVLRSSWCGTYEYSHDLIAKKRAPQINCVMADSNGDDAKDNSCLNVGMGSGC